MIILTEPETLPEELSQEDKNYGTFPATLTAISLHKESKIELITILEQNIPQSSVFIYPLTLDFTDDVLIRLREGYRIVERLYEREFADNSMEEVNKALLQELLSNFTYNHKYGRTHIIEQVYSHGISHELEEIIKHLKP